MGETQFCSDGAQTFRNGSLNTINGNRGSFSVMSASGGFPKNMYAQYFLNLEVSANKRLRRSEPEDLKTNQIFLKKVSNFSCTGVVQ
jgi:hypothetical protein